MYGLNLIPIVFYFLRFCDAWKSDHENRNEEVVEDGHPLEHFLPSTERRIQLFPETSDDDEEILPDRLLASLPSISSLWMCNTCMFSQ